MSDRHIMTESVYYCNMGLFYKNMGVKGDQNEGRSKKYE